MRPHRLLLPTFMTLATSLSACQTNSLPTSVSSTRPIQGNITPSPNGPRPLPLSPSLELSNPVQDASKVGNNHAAGSATSFPPTVPQMAPVNAPAAQPREPIEGVPGTIPEPSVSPSAEPSASPTATATSDPNASSSPAMIASASPSPMVSASPNVFKTDFFYFSYDDSASTAGVEQTKYALQNKRLPEPSWVRPWEFLSYEKFDHQNQKPMGSGKFKISMGMWQHGVPGQSATAYDLGIHLTGPEITLAERRNLNLTLVLDVSGSMDEASEAQVAEGSAAMSKLEVAKIGLKNLVTQLKNGDVVNLVTFSDDAKVRIKNWTYTGDASEYLNTVSKLVSEASTNLDAGLTKGYELARASYDKARINRVVMLTDAFANQGQTNSSIIKNATRINDAEGIYFSGLGMGVGFQEAFLNELTEAGKGTYFSVITKTDATRAFGERFMSLVNIAAENVRFRLDYPAQLERTKSAAEQSSKTAADVQPIHFSYNTSQFFLEQFKTTGETTLSNGSFKLTIDYTDPISQQKMSEVYEQTLDQVRNQDLANIKDARVITLLTALIKGQTTPAQGKRELEDLLQTHTSSLAAEYKAYINTWLGLSPNQPVPTAVPPQTLQ